MNRLTREKQVGVLNGNKITISQSIYIKIPSNYPFTCPTMYVHGVDHVKALTLRFSKYKPFIDKYQIHIPCFCCSTLTCNWSPCNTCHDMYTEYVHYNKMLKTIASAKTYFGASSLDDLVLTTIAQFLI